MAKLLNKTLLIRTLSGVGLAVVVVGAILLSHYSFAALVVVIAVGCLVEFYRIARRAGVEPQVGSGVAMAVAVVAAGYVVAHGWLAANVAVLLLPMPAVVFIVELYRKKKNPLANVSATVTGVVYTAVAMSALFFVAFDQLGGYRPWMILAYIFIIWANDVGAYLVGVAIGRHRLFERISPKKSWEGFFGGVIFAVGVAVAAAAAMDHSVWFWVGLAVVVVVTGVFGDLVESMLKRSVDIKDSGAILPGHGGFLDRFDAMILSAPFVFVYFMLFGNYLP